MGDTSKESEDTASQSREFYSRLYVAGHHAMQPTPPQSQG